MRRALRNTPLSGLLCSRPSRSATLQSEHVLRRRPIAVAYARPARENAKLFMSRTNTSLLRCIPHLCSLARLQIVSEAPPCLDRRRGQPSQARTGACPVVTKQPLTTQITAEPAFRPSKYRSCQLSPHHQSSLIILCHQQPINLPQWLHHRPKQLAKSGKAYENVPEEPYIGSKRVCERALETKWVLLCAFLLWFILLRRCLPGKCSCVFCFASNKLISE